MSEARALLRREGTAEDGRPWLIRPTRSDEDAPALVAIRDEVAAEGGMIAGRPGERTVLEESLALANLLAAGGLAVTLEVDGVVCGHLMVHRRRGPYESHLGDLSIALGSGCRGQGLGRTLIEIAVDWARAVGMGKLTLGVFPGNQRALALYRSCGFVEEGVLRGHVRLPSGDADLVVMGLRL
jgi:RimJ/RimL family protein N-acetyltransferase